MGLALIWFGVPPILGNIRQQNDDIAQLQTQLQVEQKHQLVLDKLQQNSTLVDSLYTQANIALPINPDYDLLLLQLDGLMNDLKLTGLKITAPLGQGISGQNGAVIKSGNENTITISGSMNYQNALTLFDRLKTFGRWNKIASIDLAMSGSNFNVTIISQVFNRSQSVKEFNGDNTNFLDQAKQTLSNLQAYSVAPAIEQGQFGRSDPFAPTK